MRDTDQAEVVVAGADPSARMARPGGGTSRSPEARWVLEGVAQGPLVVLDEPLSFWGGVDPETGRIIDVHHPQHGLCLTGAVVAMTTSRGSCSGSGVVLDLALSGRGPAALLFTRGEDVAALGALVAAEMFGRTIPVVRLSDAALEALRGPRVLRVTPDALEAGSAAVAVARAPETSLALSEQDRAMLAGAEGPAVVQAMRIMCALARQQGAAALIDITRAHIDGCIYASHANLTFAEAMADLGARVRVPTTTNAISVDRENWPRQGVPPDFGASAARLADAYTRMGCRPTFTCAPYLLADAPGAGEMIGWSESNAVIFANSVLGARTAKHPDFLDLCIALTGRAPLVGPYLDAERRARRVIHVEPRAEAGDAFWPLVGYLAGLNSPDRVPLLTGLAPARPTRDDLKALCAAFGTSSAAPMLHIDGVTPEAAGAAVPQADHVHIGPQDLAKGWMRLHAGPESVDLVAIGSPHASLAECRALAARLDGRRRRAEVDVIVTAGREVIAGAERDGTLARLRASGVQVLPDLCWCSIRPPVFPDKARCVITSSGKYAHYGPGLSGAAVRLGTLDDCVEAALSGRVPTRLPAWLP